jgi:hypothetical protein
MMTRRRTRAVTVVNDNVAEWAQTMRCISSIGTMMPDLPSAGHVVDRDDAGARPQMTEKSGGIQ